MDARDIDLRTRGHPSHHLESMSLLENSNDQVALKEQSAAAHGPPTYNFSASGTTAPGLTNHSQQRFPHTESPRARSYASGLNGAGVPATENGYQPAKSSHSDSRPASGHPPTAHQLRLEKASVLVDRTLRVLQKAKLAERKRRGVFVDAWIKARSMPEGWDSEEDEFGRVGGLDDVRADGGVAVELKSEQDSRTVRWNVGDAGLRVGEMANGLNRLARTLKKLESRDRKRRSSQNASRKRKAESTFVEDEGVWRPPQQPHMLLTSSFPPPPPQQAGQQLPSLAPPSASKLREGPGIQQSLTEEYHQSTPKSTIKRRRRRKASQANDPSEIPEPANDHGRKTSLSGTASSAPFTWVPKGRKRKDSDVNRDTGSLRPGEMGIPRDVFFAPGSGGKIVETAATSGTPRRRRTKSAGGSVRDEEPRAVGEENLQPGSQDEQISSQPQDGDDHPKPVQSAADGDVSMEEAGGDQEPSAPSEGARTDAIMAE